MSNEFVETSEVLFPIPAERRVIAFRAGGIISIYQPNTMIWPKQGSIKTMTERGLYAVKIGQNYREVLLKLACNIDPIFHILEVDPDKILYTNIDEIAFTEANILFCGDIQEFIIEILKYAGTLQYLDILAAFSDKLSQVVDFKSKPINYHDFAKQSVINAIDGIMKFKNDFGIPKEHKTP